MKKVIILVVLAIAGYVYVLDWFADRAVEYVTPEGSVERAAEDLIRDIWGAQNHWQEENMPKSRVVSVKSIPQVDETQALDMRIRIDSRVTESEIIFGVLRNLRKFIPKLLADEKFNPYNEFRMFGSLPMSKSGYVSEDGVFKLCLTRSEASKISWGEIDEVSLHKLLLPVEKRDAKCTYWFHGGILSRAKYLK